MDYEVKSAHAHGYDELVEVPDGVYEEFSLSAGWDGCVHIGAHRNGERQGYMHICDLDAYIMTLVDFRNRAATHYQAFNAEWPETTLAIQTTPPST